MTSRDVLLAFVVLLISAMASGCFIYCFMSLFDWGSTDRELRIINNRLSGIHTRFDQMSKKLDDLIDRVKDIQQSEKSLMAKVDDVLKGIEELTTVEEGVLQLCTTLHDMLVEAKTDPKKLE